MDLPEPLGRPLVASRRWGAWVVMAFAICWGYLAYDRDFDPDWLALGWDPGGNVGANLRTYRYTARLAREGQSFYEVAPPGLEEWAVYLYPPITVVAYYPFTLLEWMHGYWLLVCLNVLAGLVVAGAIVQFVDGTAGQLAWLDVALITGVVLLSPFTFGTIYYGNINLLVALAFVVGFLALEHDRPVVSGAAFGLAALFKLFPALVGAWLLRRRAWRAVASAIAVGGGGLFAGLVVYGWGPTATFFTEVLVDRAETAAFVGGYPAGGTFYVTVQRPLSHLLWGAFPGAPPELLTPLSVLVCGGALAVFYTDVETFHERLVAILATVFVTVTVFPALQWYLVLSFFPMVPLWYVWDGPGRLLFLAGGAVMFGNAYPAGLVEWVREFGLPPLPELVLANVFTFATMQLYGIAIMLVACALAKFGVHPRREVARLAARFSTDRREGR